VGTVDDVSIEGQHEPLIRPHLVQVHGAQLLYLINHVHHQVWHDIEERWWEAHLELAKSLCDELFQGRQLSFIDDLLGDATKEVAHLCDHHLHIL
jgi:hypothetical protein